MAPTKWRNSVYVLMEISHQRSKWLGPYFYTGMYSYVGKRTVVHNNEKSILINFFGINFLNIVDKIAFFQNELIKLQIN